LSTAAFNALLKTLEEPPPHVIFVLATTEAHKVLPTIVSRCQRFDFRRIRMRDIVNHLRHVAEGEGLRLEPAAAEMIARAAQGGMRDALSLLDQAITFCGTQIDTENTRRMLGLADPAALRALIEAVADQDTAAGLERIHTLVASGADLRQLTAQYGEEWRALLLARAGADVATIMDRTAEEAQTTVALAGRFSLDQLAACARIFARNDAPARGLPVPQLALELAFLECVSVCSGAASTTTLPAQTSQTSQAPQPRAARPKAPATEAHPLAELPLAVPEERIADAPPSAPSAATHEPAKNAMTNASARADIPADIPTEREKPRRASSAPPPAQSGPQDPALLEFLRDIQRRWTMIKKVCKQKSSMVSGLLNGAEPVRLEVGDPPFLVVAVKWPFHLEKLREPSKREAVEWALEQVLERPMRVRMVLAGEGGSGGQTATRPAPQRPPLAPAPELPEQQSPPDDSAPNNIVQFPKAQSASAPMAQIAPQTTPTARASEAAAPTPATPPQRQPERQAERQADDLTALEREVRADPVVQELMRLGGTELTEVRPLEDDEHS
jgi:DNA polymerase III subunit gamma/tau